MVSNFDNFSEYFQIIYKNVFCNKYWLDTYRYNKFNKQIPIHILHYVFFIMFRKEISKQKYFKLLKKLLKTAIKTFFLRYYGRVLKISKVSPKIFFKYPHCTLRISRTLSPPATCTQLDFLAVDGALECFTFCSIENQFRQFL